MKQTLTILLLILFSLNISAQDDKIALLQDLYEKRSYDEIINKHASKAKKYPAKAIYFVALAYYMKSDDENCLKMMNQSIKKDPTDPDAHYIKGMTLNYLKQYEKGIESFKKAIELYDKSGVFFTGLGDSYYNLEKYEKALEAYQQATKKDGPVDRPYTMIPQIYSDLNQKEKALENYYIAKDKISKQSNSYLNILYNIGLYEYQAKNYDKAETSYQELLKIVPDDYHTYAKMIQIHYARKEYSKSEPWKKKLYKAYEDSKLKGNLKDMFCFDQFDWKDKHIQVFERFAEPEGQLYYKHVFYVMNEKGQIESSIQTENSVVSVELGGPKYLIGMNKGDSHYTFSIGYEEDFKYDDLKKTVIEILEGKLKPGASSNYGK